MLFSFFFLNSENSVISKLNRAIFNIEYDIKICPSKKGNKFKINGNDNVYEVFDFFNGISTYKAKFFENTHELLNEFPNTLKPEWFDKHADWIPENGFDNDYYKNDKISIRFKNENNEIKHVTICYCYVV